MRTVVITLLTSLILVGRLMAQNPTVTGQVADQSGRPIPFANVLILAATDSALVTGGVTDESGCFQLKANMDQRLFLKISFVGYQDLWKVLLIDSDKISLGQLVMETGGIALEGVTISGRKPLIRREAGNIVTTIENSSLSMLGTADDLMRYIPGIIQTDNTLEVAGKGSPAIYVDGRKLRDQSELSRYSSNDIKTVKLVLNPGAEYEADTRAVIDIQTNRRGREGLYVYALGRLSQRHHLWNNEMIDLSYSKGHFDWFLNYTHSYSRFETETSKSQRKVARDTLTLQEERSKDFERSNYHGLSTSFNFTINDRHTLGARYALGLNDHQWQTDGSPFEVSVNGVQQPTTYTSNLSNGNNPSHQVNIFYKGNHGERLTWQLDADYFSILHKNRSEVDETTANESLHTDQHRDRSNWLAATKLIMGYEWERGGRLSWGGEYSYVRTSGTSGIDRQESPTSDAFMNSEKKYAAFLSYRLQKRMFTLDAGLRYENVAVWAESNGQTLTDRHYSELYPSVALLYTPTSQVELGLDFSKRVRRPSFGDLSNERIYYNQYYWFYGNPVLEPEDIYEMGIRMAYKALSFRLNYEHIKHFIAYDFSIHPTNALITIEQAVNYPKFQRLGATLTGEKRLGPWQVVLNMSFYKPFLKLVTESGTYHYDKPYLDLSINNTFTLPLNFLVRLDGYFYSGGSRENKSYAPRGRIDLSLSKAFLDETLVVTLQGGDLFRWMDSDIIQEMNGLVIDQRTRGDSRSVSLSVTWRLNNQKSRYKGTGAGKDAINRL